MQLFELRKGDQVRMIHGAMAEVILESEDGRWLRVRYLESRENPELTGTEDLCSEDEIAELIERGQG